MCVFSVGVWKCVGNGLGFVAELDSFATELLRFAVGLFLFAGELVSFLAFRLVLWRD